MLFYFFFCRCANGDLTNYPIYFFLDNDSFRLCSCTIKPVLIKEFYSSGATLFCWSRFQVAILGRGVGVGRVRRWRRIFTPKEEKF